MHRPAGPRFLAPGAGLRQTIHVGLPLPLTSRLAPGPDRTIPAAEAAAILHATCQASPAVRIQMTLVIIANNMWQWCPYMRQLREYHANY